MSRRGENIRKRADNRWEGRYKCGKDISGKTIYKSVYGKTYNVVKEKLTKAKSMQLVENSYEMSMDLDITVKVDDAAIKWLDYVYEKNKYSTYVKYYNIYMVHIKNHIGTMRIGDITQNDCLTLLKYEYMYGNSNNSGNTMSKSLFNSLKYVLKQILGVYGNDINIGEINNIVNFNSDKYKKIIVFNCEEQRKLINYLLQDIDDNYKVGILMCLFTGMRLGEICALEVNDIDLENRIIRINKTVQRIKSKNSDSNILNPKTELYVSKPKSVCSIREIPLCDFLCQILENKLHSKKYFVSGNKYAEPRTYEYKLKSYLKVLNIEGKKFHTLRHTFATNCIESGMDIKCLSEILGHADVKTTLNKYVHPSHETKLKQLNIYASNYGQSFGQN